MLRKLNPERLPGGLAKRVFIGGSYRNMDRLRDIKKAVDACGFFGVIARDYKIEKRDIHDWDLRLLHNCMHAIFYLSAAAGELMEIERARDYRCRMLLLYGVKGEDTPSPEHLSSMVRSAGYPLRGFLDTDHLKRIVTQFLRPEGEPLSSMHTSALRYIFGGCFSTLRLRKDRSATRIYAYRGLRAVSDDPISKLPFQAWVSTGVIRTVAVRPRSGKKVVKWVSTGTGASKAGRYATGVIRISPALTRRDPAVDYDVIVETERAFAFTREEYSKSYPGEAPLEESSLQLIHPVEKLVLTVETFPNYPLNPEYAVQYGAYREPDILINPQYSFDSSRPSRVVWEVSLPKLLHSYVVRWELMGQTEFEGIFGRSGRRK